jgi:hypothetical protein
MSHFFFEHVEHIRCHFEALYLYPYESEPYMSRRRKEQEASVYMYDESDRLTVTDTGTVMQL